MSKNKFQFDKILQDLKGSAQEVAKSGLELGGKALEKAAAQLKVAEAALRKQADKLAKGEPPAPPAA